MSRMNYVVLDTDVASLNFRRRLPAAMAARLAGFSFVASAYLASA
jgi:hypothetical protein